jgi:hypothetical protein
MAKIERCQAFHFGYERDQMKVKRKDNKENKKRLCLRVYSTQVKLNRDGRKIQKIGAQGKTLEHVDCVGWWWLVHRRVLREREEKATGRRNEKVHLFLFPFLFLLWEVSEGRRVMCCSSESIESSTTLNYSDSFFFSPSRRNTKNSTMTKWKSTGKRGTPTPISQRSQLRRRRRRWGPGIKGCTEPFSFFFFPFFIPTCSSESSWSENRN